jgi:tetratricopeptide (TPR) repeat protein
VRKKATLLNRRISDWLEISRGVQVPVGISPHAARRRARQLRREILDGEIGSREIVLDEDLKSVLYALVLLSAEAKVNQKSIEESDRIHGFLKNITWHQDRFAEKEELLAQFELFQARARLFGQTVDATDEGMLPAGDPFRRRPRTSAKKNAFDQLASAQKSDSETSALSSRICEAAFAGLDQLEHLLTGIDLVDSGTRAALLLAVRRVGLEIAQDPACALGFARLMIERLEPPTPARHEKRPESDQWRLSMLGWSHRLAGNAYLWTGDLAKSGFHLRNAYRLIAKAGGSSLSLALVESPESQRRTFLNRPREGVALAIRARHTYEALGLDDELARAWVTEGFAYVRLNRLRDAMKLYRRAIPVFEKLGLWSNYVSALNSLGTALTVSGRVDDAKREFARALKRISGKAHQSILVLIRSGLAELLFREGRYTEAAVAAARAAIATASIGLIGFSLKIRLLEIESWARAGEAGRALDRLEDFRNDVTRRNSLDRALLRQIQGAIGGRSANFKRLAELRRRAEINLVERAAGIAKRKRGRS